MGTSEGKQGKNRSMQKMREKMKRGGKYGKEINKENRLRKIKTGERGKERENMGKEKGESSERKGEG